MLAEGLLPGFLYKDGKHRGSYKTHVCQQKSNAKNKPEIWKDQLAAVSASNSLETQNQSVNLRRASFLTENKEKPLKRPSEELSTRDQGNISVKGQVSTVLHIPRRDRNNETHLDLYTSWSCASIYTNYPDLHIGGDHIGCLRDSGCVLDHDECEIPHGPILPSMDILPGHSPHTQPTEKPPNAKQLNDEGRDKSFIFQNQPLSNSQLNIYMEKKVEEFYKQFLEENLTLYSSPTSLLFSSFLINNANQISVKICQEHKIEASRAREVLLNCLRSAVSGNSSEFSTPCLQISNVDGRKNFDCLTKKSSILKFPK